MSKIVITGMGAITPVGIGMENYWNNLTSGVSGIDKIKSFDPSELAIQIAGLFFYASFKTPQVKLKTTHQAIIFQRI